MESKDKPKYTVALVTLDDLIKIPFPNYQKIFDPYIPGDVKFKPHSVMFWVVLGGDMKGHYRPLDNAFTDRVIKECDEITRKVFLPTDRDFTASNFITTNETVTHGELFERPKIGVDRFVYTVNKPGHKLHGRHVQAKTKTAAMCETNKLIERLQERHKPFVPDIHYTQLDYYGPYDHDARWMYKQLINQPL